MCENEWISTLKSLRLSKNRLGPKGSWLICEELLARLKLFFTADGEVNSYIALVSSAENVKRERRFLSLAQPLLATVAGDKL